MSVANKEVDEQSIEDCFQIVMEDLNCCFKKTGLESNKEAREMDYVTDFLKFLGCKDPGQPETDDFSSEKKAYLMQMIDYKGIYYRTKYGKDVPDILETIVRRKANEYDQKIAEIEKSEVIIVDDLVHFEKRRQNLQWLLDIMRDIIFEARSKFFEDDTSTYVLWRRRELLRSTKFFMTEPIGEQKSESETGEVPDLCVHIQNDDFKDKMYKMPRDLCIALVRSEVEKFASQIEESEGFEFQDFFNVDENLNHFLTILVTTKTSDNEELTRQKTYVIKFIRELQTKLDKKRLN